MTDPDPPLKPRKTPRQARAQATVAAILEAAARILETGGAEALTTNFVAKTAGVSVGSLYQYFPSKEAILAELVREMRREMRDDILRALEFVQGKPLPYAMARLIRAVIHHHMHRARRVLVLEHLAERLPPDPDSRALTTEVEEALSDCLTQHGIASAPQAARDVFNLIVGMAHPALHAGERNLDALARRIEPAVMGYLGSHQT